MRNYNEYVFNAKKTYKIWFSNDENAFLNDENSDRLIQLRIKNPSLIISVIYMKSLLSETALDNMHKFETEHNIKFYSIEEFALDDAQETQCLEIAKNELINWKSNRYGNPASASDIIRMLKYVIYRYGFYADFDRDIDVRYLMPSSLRRITKNDALSSTFSLSSTPILLPEGNNDVIMFSFNKDGKLHPEAETFIDRYQKKIIANYTDTFNAIGEFYFAEIHRTIELLQVLKDLKRRLYASYNIEDGDVSSKEGKYRKDEVIFNFRDIVDQVPYPEIKKTIYLATVINMTGPAITISIARSLNLDYCLESYDNLSEAFPIFQSKANIEPSTDLSWYNNRKWGYTR